MLETLLTVGGGLVTNGLVCRLDAGNSSSYSGSGDTFGNLVSVPADGSGQSANDYTRGAGGGTDKPTFNGSAGGLSASEYWSFDGVDDTFQLSGSNTTFINSLHQDNAAFTLIAMMRTPALITPANTIFATHARTGNTRGIAFDINDSGSSLRLFVGTNSLAALDVTSSVTLSTSTIYMVGVSINEATGSNGLLFYANNGSKSTSSDTSTYSSPASGNAAATARIGSLTDNSKYFGTGTRFYQWLMYNRALSEGELDQNFNFLRGRYGI